MYSNVIKKILFLSILSLFFVSQASAFVSGIVDICTDDSGCSSTRYCSPKSFNLGRQCLTKKSVNEACTANNECQNNNCETAADGTKKCVDAKTGEGSIKWQPIAPQLQISIPTIQPFTTVGIKKTDSEGNIYIPFIGQYIAGIYRWALLVAGIIAAIIIMFGGFMYLTAAGNAERARAGKDRITGATLGLLLLLISYSILYVINPDLVSFNSLKIKVFERKEVPEYLSVADYQTYTGKVIPPKGETVQKAIEAGKKVGIDDPCIMTAILGMESGGKANAWGGDENFTIDVPMSARKNFLMSKVKYSGTTFNFTPANDNTYNYHVDNFAKIFNDDADTKKSKPLDLDKPDFGIDWRFSHGFGLGGITLFTADAKRCNGRPGKICNGQCFTPVDLFDVDKNLICTAEIVKKNYDLATKTGFNGDNLAAIVFYSHNAGPRVITSNNKDNMAKVMQMAYAQKAMAFYKSCTNSANPASVEPPDVTAIPVHENYDGATAAPSTPAAGTSAGTLGCCRDADLNSLGNLYQSECTSLDASYHWFAEACPK